MFTSGPIRNFEKVQAFLKDLPYGTKRAAIIALAEYFVGNERHGFSHDDPYKQTTRKAVYGKTFESDAQRRFVMAAIRDGRIKIGQRNPNPTNASRSYGYKLTNNGYGATITNEAPGAHWTRVWRGWKNWRETSKVIGDNINGALKHAMAAVNDVLRKRAK